MIQGGVLLERLRLRCEAQCREAAASHHKNWQEHKGVTRETKTPDTGEGREGFEGKGGNPNKSSWLDLKTLNLSEQVSFKFSSGLGRKHLRSVQDQS